MRVHHPVHKSLAVESIKSLNDWTLTEIGWGDNTFSDYMESVMGWKEVI
jgi:hypothetical protein